MAFPFETSMQTLRRTLLHAIGTGGALALGGFACDASEQSPMVPTVDETTPDASMNTPTNMRDPMNMPVEPPSTPVGMCEFGGAPQETCLKPENMKSIAQNGCGQIAPDPPLTEAQVTAKFLDNGCLAMAHACDGCCNPPVAEGTPQADGSCCYSYCTGSCCGRPFVVDGLARVAAAQRRVDWLGIAGAESRPVLTSTRFVERRIADAWLADALMEHASIASFARFTLDLLAHGAPASLVAAAQQAAMDEVEHARLCFGLSERFGNPAQGPGPLSMAHAAGANQDLADAACAALVEGCIGETLAAAEAEAALAVAVDPAARQALDRIAKDEQAHAALAFRFVSWALDQGGPALAESLRTTATEALRQLQDVSQSRETESVEAQLALHHGGRLTASERGAVRAATVSQVLRPCLAALHSARAA